MNTMAVFDSKMEVPVARKWPGAVMGDEKERERVAPNEEEEGGVRILTSSLLLPMDFP